MKHTKNWIIPACFVGLMIQIVLVSQADSDQPHRWVLIAYGTGIALAVLGLLTIIDHFRVSKLVATSESLDFMIRPVEAVGAAVFIFLAVAGVVSLAAYFGGKAEVDLSRQLATAPIWAIGLGIFYSSYVNPKA